MSRVSGRLEGPGQGVLGPWKGEKGLGVLVGESFGLGRVKRV